MRWFNATAAPVSPLTPGTMKTGLKAGRDRRHEAVIVLSLQIFVFVKFYSYVLNNKLYSVEMLR